MPSELMNMSELRKRSVSKNIVFAQKPFVNPFAPLEELSKDDGFYAGVYFHFNVQTEWLAREYLFGGIYKTLREYESDWHFSAGLLRYSLELTDMVHSMKKGKEPHAPREQVVLDQVRLRCREIGEVRGLILKQEKRFWRTAYGK